jgi:hypothetical protein
MIQVEELCFDERGFETQVSVRQVSAYFPSKFLYELDLNLL